MKKIFSFIVGLVAVSTLQAVNYKDAARITMSCSGGPETQQLDLIVDADQATPATEPNLASLYEVGQVNLYVAGNYSSYTANAISNLPVVIVTNRRDASYTFTFNVPISTDGLTLTDLRSEDGLKTINIADGESYPFSIEGETGYDPDNKTNLTIADRFIINYDPALATVTTNAYGLATFSFNQDLVAVEADAKLYIGKVVDGDFVLTPVNYVKAGEGVIVYNAAAEVTTYHFVAGTGTSDFSDNELIAASEWEYPHANKNAYVLSGSSLYLYEGENMKPNKAFLLLASAGAPKRIAFRFEEEQGVENIAAEGKAVKFIENGRVFIKRGEKIYNVQGQLVK